MSAQQASHAEKTCNRRDDTSIVLLKHPNPALARFVELFWHDDRYRKLSHRERILPTGAFTIVFDLESGSSVVSGLRTKCIDLDTGPVGAVVGVLFRPGGGRGIFNFSADELSNETVPLHLLWGSAADNLCDLMRETTCPNARLQILEDALTRRMRAQAILHPAVGYGLQEFQQVPHMERILKVVKDAGLSRRRFSQLFREQVGLTPKLYCRLRRFHWVLDRVSSGIGVEWADVAVAAGYSDQAHLTHEFREFSGFSPAAFLDAERPSGAHVRVS
ncbi:MAG TPA: helix-turn-helix domain-containing protein [Bryobacteraceae bacterium]|jgi:AraC-like DNA-binding protein